MKETYFSSTTIDVVASEIYDSVCKNTRNVKTEWNIQRSALLILDMQHYFLNENSHAYIPSAAAIIPNIMQLADVYRQHQRPVIFTRHVNTENNGANMKRWWRDIIKDQTYESTISETFDISKGITINKTQYDAFYRTPLETVLADLAVSELTITGVMTHLCCETTVRSSFVRGFEVLFPIDATATYSRAFHESTFQNLSHGFCIPLKTQDILKGYRK